ncbi:AMP-binding protein, partial [Streptomyces sp. LS1784]|uniref:AMP-binding protein n=1 Tax=Streptomyces sp. LS1784 TaxID=2851533 RepID=UPI001CCCC8FC
AGRVLGADEVAAACAAQADAHGPQAVPEVWPAAQVAYSIFTSGSTGLPKLVNVGHAGVENLCRAQTRLFGVRPGDRMLQFSSLSFDASVAELLVALYAGATLVVPGWDGGSWLGAVGRHLREHGCDIITLPPSVYARLDEEARKAIGTVVFAGEALSEVEFRAALRYSRVLNAYGPTEGTVCFSVAEPSRFASTVGRPIDGYTARVYDAERGTYAESGRGELVMVGAGVALGYEGRSVDEPGPFTTVDGRPAYHTGDEVELHDGELSYLGRMDEQIKRLGHRIGLSGLGGWLAQLLEASVVLMAEDGALVMAHTAVDRPEAELRTWLSELLPPWEMPDVLLALPELPVTDHGKADRAALRDLLRQVREHRDEQRADSPEPAGGDETETVRAIAERVLGTALDPAVSIFDAGGNSLALVRIQVALSEVFGEDAVQTVFDLLNYDFTVDDFVTGLRGLSGAPDSPDGPEAGLEAPAPQSPPEERVAAAVTAELAAFRTALEGLRPASGGAVQRPVVVTGAVTAELAAFRTALEGLRPASGGAVQRPVVVTGAGGFIGGHVLDRLLGSGRRIVVVTTSDPRELVSRHRARFERDPADFAGVEFLGYQDIEAIAEGAVEADARWGAVVHCGYQVNHLLPLERQLNGSVAATRGLVRAAAARDAQRFVFLSAASVGPQFVPLTPQALTAVRDPYSQSKFVAETYIDALEGERCGVDLLRAGLVYGHTAREGGFLERDVFAQMLRLSLRHGMLPRLDRLVPVCHVSDVADALLSAAASDGAGTREVLVHRTYDPDQLRDELGLGEARSVSPQEWLNAMTEDATADVRILAGLRVSLGEAGTGEAVRTTDRPIIRELRLTHLGA